jgi:hypothetical protein
MQDSNYEIYTSFRQAGGPHTLTVPHVKKHVKIQNPQNSVDNSDPNGITPAPMNHK